MRRFTQRITSRSTRRGALTTSLTTALTFLLLCVSGCALQATPAETTPAETTAVTVRAYVDEAIAGLSEGYYADSPAWADAVAQELPALYSADTIAGTYPALTRLTKVAGGKHSFLSTPAEASAWRNQYAGGGVPTPSATFDGAVATLTIPGFSSGAPGHVAEYLDAAADIFRSAAGQATCGWVIDLSANGGGDAMTMLAALTPLLDDGVVESFRDRDGTTRDVTVRGNAVRWDGRPQRTLPGPRIKRPGAPIAIVQSAVSASAAEQIITAFSGQQGVETYGDPSGGFTTVNDGFMLPDGAVVTLSFALMGDRNGNFHEGPINPDHPADPGAGRPLTVAQRAVMDRCRTA